MEQTTGGFVGFCPAAGEPDQATLEFTQFKEEIERIMAPAPESVSSFTALLELPPALAKEIIHSSNRDLAAATDATVAVPTFEEQPSCHISDQKPHIFHSFSDTLTLPSTTALIEGPAKFSVFAEENSSLEGPNLTPLILEANLNRVKRELPETDSNPKPTSVIASNPPIEYRNEKAAKRKEREKKEKESSKKSRSGADETSRNGDKLPFVHVRARRGQATDSHSLAERARREKINARMKLLQELVPGCNKISGTALVLDEIINHVQSLQRQVELLSMKLAAVDPRIDFDLDSILATEDASRVDCNFPDTVTPPVWQEVPVNGNRQEHQQQWQLNAFNQQPIWGREEENRNFMTPENSLEL